MSDILVNARHFPAPYDHINGTRRLSVSYRDYLRASLTFGFQDFTSLKNANQRVKRDRFLNGQRIFNMLQAGPTGLVLAPEFATLDPSEKGQHSYAHGMILAKIVADRVMGIPWLAHVDAMRRAGRVNINAESNERGDLVGRDRRRTWHSLEAKGRSTAVDTQLMDEAKFQASRVISIDQQRPQTCTGCVADLSTAPITVFLEDPPPDGGDRPRRLELPVFWDFYYSSLIQYIEQYRQPLSVPGLMGYDFAPLYLIRGVASASESTKFFLGLPHAIMRNPASAAEMAQTTAPLESPYVSQDYIALVGRLPDWPNVDRRFG